MKSRSDVSSDGVVAIGLRLMILAFAFGLVFQTVVAWADDAASARVSFESSGGRVKGTADADWTAATVKKILLAGDSLSAGQEGNLEVEIANGTYLRLAPGSEVKIVALIPAVVLHGTRGSFYLQRIARSSGDVAFETAICTVALAPNSIARLDVAAEGNTKVSVRWGSATVRGGGGPDRTLVQWQQIYIDPGYTAASPVSFDPSKEESFDSWNRIRTRQLAMGNSPPRTNVASRPVSEYGNRVYVGNAYYWEPNTYYDFSGPGLCDYGFWCGFPLYGVGSYWDDYPARYFTGPYGHWYRHPEFGPLWGIGDRYPAWATEHGMDWRHATRLGGPAPLTSPRRSLMPPHQYGSSMPVRHDFGSHAGPGMRGAPWGGGRSFGGHSDGGHHR